jgi:hypothetical protein
VLYQDYTEWGGLNVQ